jgi:hypothetical protein
MDIEIGELEAAAECPVSEHLEVSERTFAAYDRRSFGPRLDQPVQRGRKFADAHLVGEREPAVDGERGVRASIPASP